VRKNATRSTDSIVASLERYLEPGPLARIVWQNSLRAAVIHHQDMRRPLGADRTIPPERLVAVLDAVLTPLGSGNIGARAHAKGLRLRATDVEWTRGAGPEVWGPGEALLMALAGRGVALADLHGAGKEVLAARIAPAAQMPARP
jgi:uncharacterized protein (TIGR03083 family)